MQQLIVALAVAASLLFIGLRLWKTLRHPKDISCGCGCSGCSSAPGCDSAKSALPLHKP